ncbi:hypothetical protein AAVH_40841 [Aphelenchoides avenae]|nr:hypothetical protein AAVH_40841 [Aphelenchus avenae]
MVAISAAQRISSPANVYEVQEGESVDLPCNAEGLNKSQEVVTWMRGDRILTMDEEVVYAEDPRLDMNIEGADYVLTISAVKSSDSQRARNAIC